jgi:hypothetical protein
MRLRLRTAANNGLLFIPKMIYDYEQSRWSDSGGRKPRNGEKETCPIVHLKSHMG